MHVIPYVELLHNLALLIALAALYQVVIANLLPRAASSQTLLGVLFGCVAVLAMVTPVKLMPGIIFDGRSIVLSVGGLIGGPLVALISATLAAAYRVWLGGAGAPVGVSVIVASASIGVAFHYYRRRIQRNLNVTQLLGFGLLVHLVMLLLFQFLPDGANRIVWQQLGPIIVIFYPVATALIGLLFQDYERQHSSNEQLHRLAYYDALSGLPNRLALTDALDRALHAYQMNRRHGALLFFNIDRFKTLNDARGHATGDALLQAVSERAATLLHKGDMLARMAADEFAVLLDGAGISSDAAAMQRLSEVESMLHALLRQPLHVGMDEIAITVSLGVAPFPLGDGDTHGEVMRRADTALHRAKQDGGNRTVVFEQSMAHRVEQNYALERELRAAIVNGELRLYLQSQHTAEGEVVGAEALVRWQHPQRGLVSPGVFIPIAEESDLVVELGMWVFRRACTIVAEPVVAGRSFRLAVNISPRHFRQPGFAAWVRDTLAETGADPRHLTLEITEGLLIDNVGDAVAKMIELAALGIRFSIDDFGTGYSSLTYLKRLPIHEIKIDKAFVQGAPVYAADANLVQAILAVAERMGLDVVAEGVETAEQATFLRQYAAIIYQGFLFAVPQPDDEWLQRLREQ